MNNKVFLDTSLMSIVKWFWSQWQHNYERNLELILINWPNLDEKYTKKREHYCQHYCSIFEANHLPLYFQSQIHLLVLPLYSSLWALRIAQSRLSTSFSTSYTLPYQLNMTLLFLQPRIFCWNKDIGHCCYLLYSSWTSCSSVAISASL